MDSKIKKELKSSYSGNILYLPFTSFIKKYPLSTGDSDTEDSTLGKGGFGIVYASGNKYAVKVTKDISSMLIELNIYSSLSHPCILKPIAWSFNKNKAYLAMPVGLNIADAYERKLISIEEIMADTLSAIHFMNIHEFIHSDIKTRNILYYKDREDGVGRACLIDMGIARETVFSDDGNYYVTGQSYSPSYRDPEYCADLWNNISCELYALAVTYYDIVTGKVPSSREKYTFRTGIKEIDKFIKKATLMIEDDPHVESRPSIEKMMDYMRPYLVRIHYGEVIRASLVEKDNSQCNNKKKMLMEWLLDVADRYGMNAKTIFLACHLIHRCLTYILPHYLHKQKGDLQALGCMCLYVAAAVYVDIEMTYEDWMDVTDDAYSEEELKDMLIQVLKALNCRITSHTYWHYAKSEEDLPQLLADTLGCNYTPKYTRPLLYGKDKNITARKLNELYRNMENKNTVFQLERGRVHACNLDLTHSVTKFLKYLDSSRPTDKIDSKIDIKILIGLVLHERFILYKLPLEDAISVYSDLYTYSDAAYVLDMICDFKWRHKKARYLLQRKVHPFKNMKFYLREEKEYTENS